MRFQHLQTQYKRIYKLDRRHRRIGPFGLTGFSIGWDTDRDDLASLTENFIQRILRTIETQVAHKQRCRRFRDFISESLASVALGCIIRLGLSNVDVDWSAINIRALQFQCLLCLFRGLEVDVTKTLGSTGVTVGDDPSGNEATDRFEDAGEPFLVNVPREIADKDAYGTCGFGLGALVGGLGRGGGGFFTFLADSGFGFFLFFRGLIFILV